MRDIKLAIYIAMHSSIKSLDHLGEILTDLGKGSGLFFHLNIMFGAIRLKLFLQYFYIL